MPRVIDRATGRTLAPRVRRASALIERMVGLLATPRLEEGAGLWIERCNWIMTWFMRYPIDAVFVARDGTILKICRDLAPFRLSPMVRGATAVLELPAGAAARGGYAVGQALTLEESA